MKPTHTPQSARRRALQWTAAGLAAFASGPLWAQRAAPATAVEVWKDASCGCCHDWIAHMEQNGFRLTAHATGNTAVRARLDGGERDREHRELELPVSLRGVR